ncbi:nucleolar protein [Ceratocystis pirilliformis]|uniref:Nucleolar protein n=1 Tax=Ceratocystis pirilliformis TaxID=259994 RepID=A0ABR3YWK1_9PEZI
MAPELRKRNAASASPAVVKTTPIKNKRKAAEDSSPAVAKKPKASSKSKPKEKSTPNSKKIKASKPEPEPKPEPTADVMDIDEDETVTVADITIQDEDVEEEVDAELQALAAGLDSDNEGPSKSTFKSGEGVGKIPSIKGKKSVKSHEKEKPGVVYIGRIPHGFYETEMKQYFGQFGPILRLRMSRNKRTGASKHFAFIEFREESTASIVAKTMDNYLLFGHILKCKVVPTEKLHADVWKGANKRFKKIPYNKMEALSLKKPKTESNWTKRVERENQKRLENAKKLKAIGYSYKPIVAKNVPVPLAIENGDVPKAIEKKESVAIEETQPVAKQEPSEPAQEKEPKPTPKKGKASPNPKAKASPKTAQKPTRASTRNKKVAA